MAKLPFKSPTSKSPTPTLLGESTQPDYGAPIRTIKQVNALIQQTLSTHLPAVFCIQGELSNFRVYDRGHAFFTLKEPGTEIPCICWKDKLAQLPFKPTDGMAVIARGSIKMYEPQGRIQLYVEALYPLGTGALELAFRQLCAKLKAEGLFETARKRPLPLLPQHVAIITSRTGDVLHDVLTTAYRRFPGLHTMLFPVPVQGPTAAPRIVEAIRTLNANAEQLRASGSGLDLILLVRGGGSLEDLWPFNEESVARAILASRIPIATGIGHEPDTTIADLVGDLRGPTPTGITELTIPDVRILKNDLAAQASTLTRETQRQLASAQSDIRQRTLELTQAARTSAHQAQQKIETFARLIARIEPRHAIAQGWRRVEEAERSLQQVQQKRLTRDHEKIQRLDWKLQLNSPLTRIQQGTQRLNHLDRQLTGTLKNRVTQAQHQLTTTEHHLKIVSPQAVLERGFSITQDAQGNILRTSTQVAPGDLIETQLAHGKIKSTVGTPRQGKLF